MLKLFKNFKHYIKCLVYCSLCDVIIDVVERGVTLLAHSVTGDV